MVLTSNIENKKGFEEETGIPISNMGSYEFYFLTGSIVKIIISKKVNI
jgi:hypothetical protein